jgi:Fic family protein
VIYLVSYNLKVPGRDYGKLYEVLKSADSWSHYLEATWMLYSSDALETWNKRIRSVLDQNDRFIIVDVTGKQRNGWLPAKAWDWIRNHQT